MASQFPPKKNTAFTLFFTLYKNDGTAKRENEPAGRAARAQAGLADADGGLTWPGL